MVKMMVMMMTFNAPVQVLFLHGVAAVLESGLCAIAAQCNHGKRIGRNISKVRPLCWLTPAEAQLPGGIGKSMKNQSSMISNECYEHVDFLLGSGLLNTQGWTQGLGRSGLTQHKKVA